MPPTAVVQHKSCDKRVRGATDTVDSAAGRTVGSRRVGVRPVELFGTERALRGARASVLTDLALDADGSPVLWLMKADGTSVAPGTALRGLVVTCKSETL